MGKSRMGVLGMSVLGGAEFSLWHAASMNVKLITTKTRFHMDKDS
jgi:hypothetical protein